MEQTQLLSEFKSVLNEELTILEGALLVARLVQPDTNTDWCRERIAHLAQMMGTDVSALRIVRKLRDAGFNGSEEYYKSENSALEHVLRHREGIPISLAVVILAICEELNIKAHGVNFPSHFLVSVGSQLVDPFRMELVDEVNCLEWLKENGISSSQAFRPASTRDIVTRMLNNLGMLATANEDNARALEISDFKLLVTPDPFSVHLERVDYWLQLGVTSMAKHDMEQAIAVAPDENTRAKLKQGLDSLSAQGSQLH